MNEGEEKFVDDRPDALGTQGSEAHEQVVAHQVERHDPHSGRDPVQVDLAAIVGALVDDLNACEPLVADDAVTDLSGREASVNQQPSSGPRRR